MMLPTPTTSLQRPAISSRKPAASAGQRSACRSLAGAASSRRDFNTSRCHTTSKHLPAATAVFPSVKSTHLLSNHLPILRYVFLGSTSRLSAYRSSSTDVDFSGTTAAAGTDAAASAVQVVTSESVTAQDTFDAVATNMPSLEHGILGQAGRWERWGVTAAPRTGWSTAAQPAVRRTLITSGQSVYAFQPGNPPGQDTNTSITVHVLEVPDESPTLMTNAVSSIDNDVTAAPPPAPAAAAADGKEMRATNVFRAADVFFEPCLPDLSNPAAHPAAGLRLWAANQHGFAMAPTHLPQDLLQQQQQNGNASTKMPFIVNLYVKHPSSTPGIGHRWGWNIQYSPDPLNPDLQHIHHTSLGLVEMSNLDEGMKLGVHDTELTTPLRLPSSIDAFMADHPALNGSAVEFTYDSNGQLQKQIFNSCTYSSNGLTTNGSSSSGKQQYLECWYSSGGYTKVPTDLASVIEAGESVVVEAGAVIPNKGNEDCKEQKWEGQDLNGCLEGVTRWIMKYRPEDGQLASARIEVYTV